MAKNVPIDCPYCLEFVLKGRKPVLNTISWPYKSRILHKMKKTVMVPTIGSIIPNHILIIPLRHTFSARSLQPDELVELKKCIDMLEKRFGGGTFFEHGSIDAKSTAGASVDHVHVHYIPIDIDLKNLTPELTYVEFKEFNEITKINGEYLFVRIKSCNYYTSVKSLPSQYFRLLMAKLFGVPSMFDWREYPFVQNMTATYNSWLKT